MEDELDILLDEEVKKRQEEQPQETIADRIEDSVKCEFEQGGSIEEVDRLREKKEISAKLKALHKELNKFKNVKNFRMRNVNTSFSEKRKKLRIEISKLEVRLKEIAEEVQ